MRERGRLRYAGFFESNIDHSLRAILTTRPAWVGSAGKGGQMQSLRLCLANARKGEITAYVIKQ
jgi:hypothetical protein